VIDRVAMGQVYDIRNGSRILAERRVEGHKPPTCDDVTRSLRIAILETQIANAERELAFLRDPKDAA
jgi:hypothetical protein